MDKGTDTINYSNKLHKMQHIWWKKLLNVQIPYRWNIRRLNLGFVLDVGCGIGRNLLHINGNGVGVDHNPHSIEICKAKGLRAYTSENFTKSEYAKSETFDTLLLSHVIEHMTKEENIKLITDYLKYIKSNGRIVIITPQIAGYKADSTHIWFADFKKIENVCKELNLIVEKKYSFPLPEFAGAFFRYNEYVVINKKTK